MRLEPVHGFEYHYRHSTARSRRRVCYTYDMAAIALALWKPSNIVLGIAGLDLVALPIAIAILVIRGRRTRG